MSSKKGLLKNIFSLSIVQVANLILPLISVPIISRIIEPDKFGVVNYAATFIAYFTLLIEYGFNLTATRRLSKDPNNIELRNTIFSEILQAKTVLFLISIILFLISIYTIEPLILEKKVAFFTFLICIGAVFTQNWFFQSMQDLSKVAIFNFLSKLLFTIFVLIIVRQKSDYIWIPLITSLVAIAVALLSFFWGIKKYNIKLKLISLKNILSLLNKEKVIFFSTVVISLYTTTNIVILGILQTDEQVGFYTAGQRLILIATGVINMPLSQAFFPFIGKAFSEGKDNGINSVHKIIPIIFITTSLAAIIMYIIGPLAINILYGKEFMPSLTVFRILVLIPLIVGLSNVFGIQIMLNLKMDKLFFTITSLGAILGIILNIIMTKLFGHIGTAWNWIIIESFITIAMYICLRKNNINPIDINQFKFSELKKQFLPLIEKIRRKK